MDQTPRPQSRPRSKSGWSFSSDKGGQKPAKLNLRESPSDKRKSHMSPGTKADPNAAVNEVQPNVAALEENTMTSLGSVQHTDSNGNPIDEPDFSNPTRSRWERPLDTIRSFEEQIDSAFKRRSTMMGPPHSAPITSGMQSRRSSYFGALDNGYNQRRYSQVGGFYGRPRESYSARDSYYNTHESYSRRNSYAPREAYSARDQYDNYGPPVPRHRHSPQRTPGEYTNRHSPHPQNFYPSNGYHQSRDTVGTGESGSHSEPWTNSTDPSSEDSSVDPQPPVKQPDIGEQYGFTGFGGDPIIEEYDPATSANPYGDLPPRPQPNGAKYYNIGQQPQRGSPPKSPPKVSVQPLNSSAGNATQRQRGKLTRQESSGSEKRMSWIKRRFSKA